MSDADLPLLGLFALGIVLLPGEIVPLHIFEPRYKKLIREHLDDGEFGTVLAEEDKLRECGTAVRVAQVIEKLDDGRINVLVQGLRRFRIVALVTPDDPERDYLRARVDFYDDALPEATERLQEAVWDVFSHVLRLMDVEQPREPGGEGPLSFRVAAAVDFGAPLKQELLESRSEEQRLVTLLTVMTSLLPRLELRKQREDAIRGNGKGY